MFWNSTIALVMLALAMPAAAEMVTLEATRDATIIEDPDGAAANGSGPSFFAGRTSQDHGGVRRAVIYFDVVSVIPRRAVIEDVRLTLYVKPSNAATSEMRLYKVLADWGEGPSASSGGGGRPAEPGDVTWLHAFYPDKFWAYNGGQFLGAASASLPVAGSGFYTWENTRQLKRDVRLWVRAPERNHGWIVIGDETARTTAKNFASREDPDPTLRPTLEITYRLP